MKKIIYFMLFYSITAFCSSAWASEVEKTDNRTNLNLTPAEKSEFLAEMRQMLISIQGIVTGIGTQDREQIIRSAQYSGNRMARATPESVRNKLPKSFKEIGGPMHMMFEELAIRAQTDDMDMLMIQTGKLLQQCVTCHATFKAN